MHFITGIAACCVEWEVEGDALAFAHDRCLWRGKGNSIEWRGPVHNAVREADFFVCSLKLKAASADLYGCFVV
jgi:hypothetical protein